LEKPLRDLLTLDSLGRSLTVASRKSARAQVWLIKGTGQVYINGVNFCSFFPEKRDKETILKPFEVADCLGKYNIWAVVTGGGKTGQADAISVACARGLVVFDASLQEPLSECIYAI
jgi:small subunit ribosomal protein S9